MPTLTHAITRKARKAHACTWCSELIEPGQHYETWSGVEPGQGFWRVMVHPECHNQSEDDEDWEWAGQYKRGTGELR